MPKAPKTDPQVDYPESAYQPLPNKEAIVAFNGKALLTSESYLDVKAYQHALAFTVAGLMDEDFLKETRDAIASALENGTDFRTFKQRLKPYLMSKGWLAETLDDGTQKLQVGSNRRLRTIYSTNLQSAYSAGQWSRIQQTKEFLPYLQYMPSVSENPRLSHKKYYGLCRPADDPIWTYIMPQNGWGCKCWVKQLTKKQAQKVGISDEKPLETESYTNSKTGEKSQIPVGIDPSFVHNHDPITAVLRLAEDRHGKEFADKLKKQAEKLLPDTLPIAVTVDTPNIPAAEPDKLPEISLPEEPVSEPDWEKVVEEWITSDKRATYDYLYKTLDKKKFPLTKEEFFALRWYTQNGYKELNQYLRGELPLDDESKRLFDNVEKLLNNGLERLPLYKGKKVVRRITLTEEQIKEYNDIGKEVIFKAFSSTTTNAKDVVVGGKGNVRFVIEHKTGRDVRKLSNFESEGEVLLGTPTKYRIRSFEDLTSKKGYVEIHLEEFIDE